MKYVLALLTIVVLLSACHTTGTSRTPVNMANTSTALTECGNKVLSNLKNNRAEAPTVVWAQLNNADPSAPSGKGQYFLITMRGDPEHSFAIAGGDDASCVHVLASGAYLETIAPNIFDGEINFTPLHIHQNDCAATKTAKGVRDGSGLSKDLYNLCGERPHALGTGGSIDLQRYGSVVLFWGAESWTIAVGGMMQEEPMHVIAFGTHSSAGLTHDK